MNTYSNRGIKPTAAYTQPCSDLLFIPKNKGEQAFPSLRWLSLIFLVSRYFFWHVQRFLMTDSVRQRQKTEQGTGGGCEKEWNMCKRQEESGSGASWISENIAVRRHERAEVEKTETAECIRDIETESKKDTAVESCAAPNKRSWEGASYKKKHLSSIPIRAAILGG